MKFKLLLCGVALVLSASIADATLTTNSWLALFSDRWDNANFWSAHAPTNTDAAELLTNATVKTLTIDGATPLGSLTVSNITIQGVGVSTNVLRLIDTLTNTVPRELLVLKSLTVGTNAILTVTNSALRVGAGSPGGVFSIDGVVTLEHGSIVATNSSFITTIIGDKKQGSLIIKAGTMLNSSVHLGDNAGSSGTLTIAGGTNSVPPGNVFAGSGSNGFGAVWIVGSHARLDTVDPTHATSIVLGGTDASGQLTISNGSVLTLTLFVGSGIRSHGTLTAVGGTVAVMSRCLVGNFDCASTGIVNIAGGQLFATNATHDGLLELRSGTFTLSSGTVRVDQFVITNACAHFVRTGGTLIYSNAVLDAAGDDDGDGLPNGYEQSHGLDPLDPFGDNGANGDPDRDGFTNLQEFSAGTDPTNSASFLRILSVAREGNNIRLTWSCATNHLYIVQTNSPPASGSYTNNFADLTFILVPGSGGTSTNYLDIGGATNKPARYYRVQAQLPN